jgi:hypothetical protein
MRSRTSLSRPKSLPLFAVLCGALLGCSGDPASPSDDPPQDIVLSDEHNYSSESSLSIPTVETASGVDIDLCWANVTTDLQCHDVDPIADLDNVGLLRLLNMTEEDVEASIAADDLPQSAVDGYLSVETDHESTCAKLSDLTFFGTVVDIAEAYVESAESTFMLLVSNGTMPGVGARSMVFLKPTSESDVTRVDVQEGCGILEFSADLSSAETLSLPSEGPWTLDWSELSVDGGGKTIVFQDINRLVLGFYAGMSVSDIEARIFDLELMATELFEISLPGGRTADLSLATERTSGEAFSSFARDEDGVWLLGLICSDCRNPSPIVLTVLEPQD